MFSTLKGLGQIEKIHGYMKNVGCRILLSHIQAFAAPTKNKDTDSPRGHICTYCATWTQNMYMHNMDIRYILFFVVKVAKFEYERRT